MTLCELKKILVRRIKCKKLGFWTFSLKQLIKQGVYQVREVREFTYPWKSQGVLIKSQGVVRDTFLRTVNYRKGMNYQQSSDFKRIYSGKK